MGFPPVFMAISFVLIYCQLAIADVTNRRNSVARTVWGKAAYSVTHLHPSA